MSLDVAALRAQFPIFGKRIDGNPLVYLDTAATAQKPQAVLDAMHAYYAADNANVNRGVHPLAERATMAYDAARACVARYIGAAHAHEVIFTKNCTEAMNLAARSFGSTLKKGDAVALTVLEHHSNVVPWLQLQEERGIRLEWIDIDDRGELRLDQLRKMLEKKKVKLVAVTGLSNVLGTRSPLGELIDMAHAHGAKVLVDAAQLLVHETVNVRTLDIDFLAFSGHKLYGPTGIGVLYGKQDLLKAMPAFLGGGDMIRSVTRNGFTTAELPRKFEAGTPPVAEAIGLKAAIDWLQSHDRKMLQRHEHALILHALQRLKDIRGLRVLGSGDAAATHGCISFVVDRVHPHDLTEILGRKGICLRAGHHCTQPLHQRLGIPASARLSVGVYNTMHDIDACITAIEQAQHILHA
jgi:cysteine desulfurase/selenocysteine lyase